MERVREIEIVNTKNPRFTLNQFCRQECFNSCISARKESEPIVNNDLNEVAILFITFINQYLPIPVYLLLIYASTLLLEPLKCCPYRLTPSLSTVYPLYRPLPINLLPLLPALLFVYTTTISLSYSLYPFSLHSTL